MIPATESDWEDEYLRLAMAVKVVSGAVTDMIRLEFVNFPVFNVADCFVTTGCALLIVYVLFFDRPKKTPPEQDGKAK